MDAIIIVTDEFHTRRVYAFEKIFEDRDRVEVAGAPNEVFSDDDCEVGLGDIRYAFETIKFPVYFFWEGTDRRKERLGEDFLIGLGFPPRKKGVREAPDFRSRHP